VGSTAFAIPLEELTDSSSITEHLERLQPAPMAIRRLRSPERRRRLRPPPSWFSDVRTLGGPARDSGPPPPPGAPGAAGLDGARLRPCSLRPERIRGQSP